MHTTHARTSIALFVSLLAATALVVAQSSRTPGIDAAGMDRSVKPGDDFFAFANGTWNHTVAIPEDRAAWGIGGELAEQASEQTRTLLEAAGRTPANAGERKAGDYYAAYMDEAAIERRGLTPLKAALGRIDAIGDRRTLAQEFGSMLRADTDPLNATNYYTDHLFGLFVAQDLNAPSRNTAYLMQGGLGMPDREYYLSDSPQMAGTRAKYETHVATILRLAGASPSDSTAQARRVVSLETKIAKAHASREDSGDIQKSNTPWTRADFDAKAPGLDWAAFFNAAGLDTQRNFIAWQASAVTGESALVASEPLDDWKLYLRYIVLNHWAGLLPKAFADENFAFYGTVLSGTPKMADRWKRGVGATNGALGDVVGQLYVQHHFPPSSRKAVEEMVADIKAAFAERIDALDWMTPATKINATKKLESLIVSVGHPDTWRDYSSLTVSRDDALGNAMRAEEYEYRHQRAKLSQPVDRREWWMTPQTVNAVNLPVQNALNFPAAILQPPYFDPRATTADNYGAIGAIIGHEISHSFDNMGSQFDASGRLANWWAPDDFAHFKTAAQKLVAQYNAYRPLPDLSVNGTQTLGENIADLAGLAAAYDAYRLSTTRTQPPMQAGFTADQQFFISYAQSWRQKYRAPLLRRTIVTDGHSPSPLRAQTVRNLDAWYAAFGVTPGEALYLAPGDRVRIW